MRVIILQASICAAALAARPAYAQTSSNSSQDDWTAIPNAPAQAEAAPVPPRPPDQPAPTQVPSAEAQAAQVPAATATAAAPPAPAGQWVYTAQYGWVWMPYSNSFVYAPAGIATPYMYVYGPAFGWAWVGAPWVWGYGPGVFFGVGVSATFFPWYGHYFYAHRFGFVGARFGAFGPRLWNGTLPAAPRGFVGAPRGFVGGVPRAGVAPPRGVVGAPRGFGATHVWGGGGRGVSGGGFHGMRR
jgi:hypothetical protein